MGCGESKHDVATGNTITQKKSDAGESKKSKDVETILETGNNDNNTNSLVQQEGENVNNDTEDVNNVVAGADIKDIAENTAKEVHGPGSLVSKESPNHYFSSRKDEEALEGIVSEGKSEKSEYCSPNVVEAEKETLFNENVKEEESFEEKKLVEETKEETKNGEPSNANEENLVKEAEVATTTEAEVSSPIGEEKSLNAEKEHSAS